MEGATTPWTFQDKNTSATQGLDYWDLTNYRHHGGTDSLWCAQVGQNNYQFSNAQSNAAGHYYDADMNAAATRDVDLQGWRDVTISYWFWPNAESGWTACPECGNALG